MRIIIDATEIIKWSREKILRDKFKEYFRNKTEVYIPDLVLKEIKSKLDYDQRLEFENVFNEGVENHCIIKSHKKYSLDSQFKPLFLRLVNREKKLSRTDSKIIALAGQLKADVITSDGKIHRILSELKSSKNPWQIFYLNINKTEPQHATQKQLSLIDSGLLNDDIPKNFDDMPS